MRWRAAVAARLASTHPDSDDVLHAARAAWQECRDLAAAEVTWPPTALPYEPMPEWARRAAASLYYLPYRSPAPFGGGVGRYDVQLPWTMDASAQEAFARLAVGRARTCS